LRQPEDPGIVGTRLGEIARSEGDPGKSDDRYLGCRRLGSCGLSTGTRAAAPLSHERLTRDQEDEECDKYVSARHVGSLL
jgi:hypothetical protein